MPGRLKNKTAIVTGAAQGIGAAIAETFAAEGARLVLFDINMDQLRILGNSLIAKYGCSVLMKNVDISNKSVVEEAISLGVKEQQRIDILVNNAGINVFSKPLEMEETDWEKCFAVNLEGAWNCCKSVLPHMLENQYGHIVNIASVHGHKVVRGAFPYSVAKHGLVGLTRFLGVEYAASGIRVNSISPGMIDTPIAISNGICWSPDSRYFYLADSARQVIYIYDFDASSGTISNRQIFTETADGSYPDGAVVDSEGYLWSAHWGGSCVVRYSPDGRKDCVLEMPVSQPTCVAFGGENMDLLFVTSARIGLSNSALENEPQAGHLFVFKLSVKGIPASLCVYP